MISTFIVENYALVRVVLVVFAVACIALTALLLWMGRTGRRIAAVLSGLALVGLLGLTLSPDKFPTAAVACTFDASNFSGDYLNMVLFFLPMLFAVVALRHPLVIFAAGVSLSAVIEFVQAVTPVLGRRCDVSDWLANSTGTALAVLVAVVLGAVVRRFSRR